ncbi:RING finger protein 32 [Trypanosoma grayi]|uniref:RING finger protein 32 n=1 Tax=Trypanosoma grayi TaxID=71804 RepID=UPI0004F4A3D5|nr:RING finger protein 32 [Trypanosoma grayi]KEG10918.1 RING finger protein 32 [Trypanosoma grayi]
MSAERGNLPSIGPKLHSGWGTHTAKRKDQVQIWSAVALQQHFARGALVSSTFPTLEAAPPPMPGGRLTLAQKMGLVPLPPPAPTEEEWTRIEGTALRRNHAVPLGANSCCICQEAFYATMEQGQVLLSCSHVFHEQCFRHFEKFARWSRGKNDATPLSCPVCRSGHYHKRLFYAGKAMAQRAAIVKIQAFFRRVLARKAYVKLRLEHDSDFCGEYAHERLTRLSDAYAAYAEAREKEQARMLENMDLRLQRALAECTTREEWGMIRKRVEVEAAEGALECPICLSAIEHNPNSEDVRKATTGEEIVAAFRREYEERVAQRKASERKSKKPSVAVPQRRSTVRTQRAPTTHPSAAPSTTVTSSKCGTRTEEASTTVSSAPRYGLLLSCGHCFHGVCLSVFERYSEMMAIQHESGPLIPRCPLCRSAYVKADY